MTEDNPKLAVAPKEGYIIRQLPTNHVRGIDPTPNRWWVGKGVWFKMNKCFVSSHPIQYLHTDGTWQRSAREGGYFRTRKEARLALEQATCVRGWKAVSIDKNGRYRSWHTSSITSITYFVNRWVRSRKGASPLFFCLTLEKAEWWNGYRGKEESAIFECLVKGVADEDPISKDARATGIKLIRRVG